MKTRGFTLIELSIVLVIIGLIVGGVLVGRDLIKAAELRSVISEVDAFQSAAKAFRLKYDCLPGDCAAATSLGLGTSGNGNGVVDDGVCGTTVSDTTAAGNVELYLFWQHLGNAQMVAGTYTGYALGGGFVGIWSQPGVNVPASKIANGGYSFSNIGYSGTTCGGQLFSGANYSNSLFFGAYKGSDRTAASLLKTIEAQNIDQKIDDGLPAYGKVVTYNRTWFLNNGYGLNICPTSDTPASAVYNMASTTAACHLVFNRLF